MNKPLGYNPIRWDCNANGYYNKTLRPRIEEFASCFPGKISMSDVDGVVEIGGRFLFLEWKSKGGTVQGGQRIMFERLTSLSPRVTVIVVSGHPREMRVEQVQVFENGRSREPEPCDFDGLSRRIRSWADRANSSRIRPSLRGAV